MKSVIHLVYPHRRVNSTPDAIGWRVADHLSRKHTVQVHDWDSKYIIRPSHGDSLIGHLHPMPGTILRRSWGLPGWRRRVLLQPYCADILQVSFADRFVRSADAFCAITGRAWAENVPFGPVAHWAPAMTHVDLAVDREDFPFLKKHFNPPGQRKILYVGHTAWYKNPELLEAVAAALPNTHFGWIGESSRGLRGFEQHGWRSLGDDETKRLISGYDILITLGRSDANPTTILEAMSWGLIPVVTVTSGYINEPGIYSVLPNNVEPIVSVLKQLDLENESVLREKQLFNLERLDVHYNWSRFLRQVERCLDSDIPSPLCPAPSWRLLAVLKAARLVSPYVLNRQMVSSFLRRPS